MPGPLAATTQSAPAEASGFSLGLARQIVSDLFVPSAAIYWADFLLSWAAGLVCFTLVGRLPPLSLLHIAVFLASCLLYYRAALFIHEIVHRRQGTFTAFSIVWNLLCGIPFLIPSFVYYTHHDHHRRAHYGTGHDGEYIPLASRPPSGILLYFSQIFIIPLLAVIRFGLLTPLTWTSRTIRHWVHRHASSMIVDPMYIRPLPSAVESRIIRFQELGCLLFLVTVALLLIRGRLPWAFVGQAYCTSLVVLGLNAIRTLGAHRWASRGQQMTFVEQMLDSVNFPRHAWLAGLWAPVGLRFHALHHVFPSMPYHNLAKAHRRLMANLPADSLYRQTEATSLCGVLFHLWRRARDARS
jgi:fatty acid desaturase